MPKPFVPDGFTVPLSLRTKDFTIRKLTPADTEQDYLAVMRAREHIRAYYSETHDTGWPQETLTIEEDRYDLEVHEREFDERKSFAYTVFDAEDKFCVGCLYIDPADDVDAEITMWTDDLASDRLLYETVRDWIRRDWPFSSVRYPVLEALFGK